MRRPAPLALAALLAALLLAPAAPSRAAAQALGWSTGPGDLATYTTQLTSSGEFFCGTPFLFAGGSCAASGNSVTLRQHDAFVTFTFTGLTQTLAATNVRTPGASLGTFTATTGGTGPVALPAAHDLSQPLFQFRLTVTQLAPVASSGRRLFTALNAAAGGTSLFFAPSPEDFLALPILSFRSGGPPQAAVFDTFVPRRLEITPGAQALTASVGVVPEPATVALVGAGVLVLGAAGRRRTRRERS